MKYFFVLGSNPSLSIAEITSVFGYEKNYKIINQNILLIETNNSISSEIIKKLGGTIKIGLIAKEEKNNNNFLAAVKPLLNPKKGKYKFGLSYYGKQKFKTNLLGMEIKKYLRNKNVSCRWVTSQEKNLSSVVVEQNKLIQNGIEIVLLPEDEKTFSRFLIGQTLAVQPFKALSFRDYGRPARDDQSGLLPPKLAQIMINLAAALLLKRDGGVILDPFCGSGTILTEAILMGYKNIIGADISEKAVSDTKQNIEWTKKNYELGIRNYELHNQSAMELSKFIKPNSVDAIVTEPYLGPPRGKTDIKKIKKELENLYSEALQEFKKILKPEGRVVMIWPVFVKTSAVKPILNRITPNLNGFKIINPLPENLRNNKIIKLTDRDTIIYGRLGQKIWREIAILE